MEKVCCREHWEKKDKDQFTEGNGIVRMKQKRNRLD